jgi:hypothetical protein
MPRGRKRREVQTSKSEGKKFSCQQDGCGRTFTRAEHLQRHLLNHSTGEYTCDRCRAHFKRRDLLGKDTISFLRMVDAEDLQTLVRLLYVLHVLCICLSRLIKSGGLSPRPFHRSVAANCNLHECFGRNKCSCLAQEYSYCVSHPLLRCVPHLYLLKRCPPSAGATMQRQTCRILQSR